MSGGASESKAMEKEGSERESMVEAFVSITSAGRDVALFFLESHNWSVDSAVQSFYDDPVEPGADVAVQDQEADDDVAEQEQEQEEEDDDVAVESDDDEDYLPSENEDEKKEKEKGKESNNRSGIKTISDLKRKSHSDCDSDSGSDSDLDGQDFYTGGEKSGMMVRDPSKRRKISKRNNAEAIFEQARKMASKAGPSKKSGSNSTSFKGKARTLAGEETPSQNPSSHDIYFWRNGFTVNNGPLRSFNDPQNASFLESIKKSECPDELKPSDGSSEIGVNLIRRETSYPVPKKRGKQNQNGSFKGKARTIGEEEGPSKSTDTSLNPKPSQTLDSSPILSSPKPSPVPPVDSSSPTTSLQIRLTDGTRLISRFTISSTIADVRAFIDASRPGGTSVPYRLQTVGFPPKELDDVSKTIGELGIGNSVVIQKV